MLDYRFGNKREGWPSVTPLGDWKRGPMPTRIGDVVVTTAADAQWFWMWVVAIDGQQTPTAGQWIRHVEGLERVKATARDHAGKDRVFFVDDAEWVYWR